MRQASAKALLGMVGPEYVDAFCGWANRDAGRRGERVEVGINWRLLSMRRLCEDASTQFYPLQRGRSGSGDQLEASFYAKTGRRRLYKLLSAPVGKQIKMK